MELKELKKLKNKICTDKTFNMILAIKTMNFKELKSHIPFFIYDIVENETLVITEVYNKKVYIDDKLKSDENKISYLRWEDKGYREYDWCKHTLLFEEFDLIGKKNAFPATDKQIATISNEKIYDLSEERVLLTSGAEAYMRINDVCRYYKNNKYEPEWDDFEQECYSGPGPWGEGT